MVRPNPAGREQVAKLRHLRAAAGHLAAAGYDEQAAKAEAEAGRLEAMLKSQEAKRERAQMKPKEPRQEQPKPAKEKADANSPLVKEIRKISQQMEAFSARVKNLEKSGHSDHD